MKKYLVKDVFVAGGQPLHTYVAREGLNLEKQLNEYLNRLFAVLSISGPTKSGKTVLVRKILPKGSALWVSGGQIENAEDFWQTVNEEFGNYTSISEKLTNNESHSEARDIDAGIRPVAWVGESNHLSQIQKLLQKRMPKLGPSHQSGQLLEAFWSISFL